LEDYVSKENTLLAFTILLILCDGMKVTKAQAELITWVGTARSLKIESLPCDNCVSGGGYVEQDSGLIRAMKGNYRMSKPLPKKVFSEWKATRR
jgi:hypothetical protein